MTQQEAVSEQERLARPLAEADSEIAALIAAETERQNEHLELIASENFTSEAVLEAVGSVFTILWKACGIIRSPKSKPSR